MHDSVTTNNSRRLGPEGEIQMRKMGLVHQIMTLALAVALLFGSGVSASATVITGESDAYNASIGLTVLNQGIGLTIPTTSGTAPAVYDTSNSILNANVAASANVLPLTTLKLGLGADLLSTHAGSNVDGTSGTRFAQGDQSITNLATGLTSTLLGFIPIIKVSDIITADLISTQARVEGDYGALTAGGLTRIFDLHVLGQAIDLTGHLDASGYVLPNSMIDLNALGLANVTLILNEQIMGGDGSSSRSMTVNAIDLDLNGYTLLGQVVSADVIIGHASAELSGKENPAPVPEPSTFLLIGSGLAGLFLWRKRLAKG